MLRYLVDPANAITSGGLIFSGLALYLALAGHLDLAVGAALWAVLADHLDGIVAGRTRNRQPEVAKMGKSLDGFADIIYGAVLPATIVIQLSHASYLSMVTGVMLLFAGAVRLSYFANFGRSADGCFMGVPLSYDVPLLAVFFLVRPLIPAPIFPDVVNAAFLALAAAHVAPIRVPSPNFAMYTGIAIFGVAASLVLTARTFT